MKDVSIHAPVRGATHDNRFSPRRCAVSIHAPVRGATPTVTIRQAPVTRFNPRARAGRDWL